VTPVFKAFNNSYKFIIKSQIVQFSSFELLREEGYKMLFVCVFLKLWQYTF
jgi:hypothetical protein